MDSRTNLVVHLGQPMKRSYYQQPRIGMEPMYNDCDGKFSCQSGSGDCRNKYGESSGTSRYQQPKMQSNYSYNDMASMQRINPPSESEFRRVNLIDNDQDSSSTVSSPTEAISPHGDANLPGEYQHPRVVRTYNDLPASPALSPKCEVISPTESTSQIRNHLEVKRTGTERSMPLKPPRKHRKSVAEPSAYQTPSKHTSPATQHLLTPSSKLESPSTEVAPPLPPPFDVAVEDKTCQVTSKEFFEDGKIDHTDKVGASSTQDPMTPSKSERPSSSLDPEAEDRDPNYQLPEIDVEFLENEGHGPSDTMSSREASYQIPSIETTFLENKEKSSSELSDSLTTPPSTASASLLPLNLPARTPSAKSLPSTQSMAGTDSPSPNLPAGALSVKSPDTSPSKPPPPVPPRTVPTLPEKTKAFSPPSPALYSELNELDRQNLTQNYEHLTSTTSS